MLLAPAAARADVNGDAARVRAVLERAHAGAQLASLRKAVTVLRRIDRPGAATRHAELAAVVHELALIAARGHLTPSRFPALFRQLDANRSWFAARGPPAPLARVQLPGDPLVYGYYPGRGLVLQPLFNWSQANGYWFDGDDDALQQLVDALAPLAVAQPGGWATWEYLFDYGGGQAPWRSAMPQAVALQAIVRAWQATGRADDLALAQRLLAGFRRSTDVGGLRDPSGEAWWPLYSFAPDQRVLNGDLQVVIGLYAYADATGSPSVRALADDGALNAESVLADYDTGAWSRYDLRQEADLEYHDLMTRQLSQVGVRSGLPEFADMALRFAAYRSTPPTVSTVPVEAPPRFYPAPADGFRDSARLLVRLDKRATLSVTVRDASGVAVAAQRLGEHGRGSVELGWDGRVAGRPAPPGSYGLEVSAVDVAGNRVDGVAAGSVVVARDATPPEVRRLAVSRAAGGRVRVRWSVRDAETPAIAIRLRVGSRQLRLSGLPLQGALLTPLRVLRPRFVARLRVTDTSGNATALSRRPR